MLGRRIDDPLSVESSRRSVDGLGLLAVSTSFLETKTRHRVEGRLLQDDIPIRGYEIHMGKTERDGATEPFARLTRLRDGMNVWDGAREPNGRVFGTYVHGLFDSLPLTVSLVNRLRVRRGLAPLDTRLWSEHRERVAARYSVLGEFLRTHLNLSPIRNALGLDRGARAPRS
jgi:adenosylcobyric acid synthase